MSRYQVPQFIEVESKVFGPLTIRQFLYLVGGGGVVFIFSLFLPLILWMLLGIPVVGFAIALAFYKVNNRPFLSVVTSWSSCACARGTTSRERDECSWPTLR